MIWLVVLQWNGADGIPGWMQPSMLSDKSWAETSAILSDNFLSASAIPKTLFLICGAPYLAVQRRSASTFIAVALVFILGSDFAYGVLSLIGKMPWRVGTRWTFNEYVLSLIGVIGLAVLLQHAASQCMVRASNAVCAIVAAASVLFVGATSFRLAQFDRAPGEYTRVAAALWAAADHGVIAGDLVVQHSMWPSFRYAYERSGQSLPKLNPEQVRLVLFEPTELRDVLMAAKPGAIVLFGTWAPEYLKPAADIAEFQPIGPAHFTYIGHRKP